MFAVADGPSTTGSPLSNLFFAIQPEPDLEFTEEELEQTTGTRSSSPMKSPKKSGGRPLLWIVLLALVGGGAYVAMEPEMVLDWVNQLLGDTAVQEPQPIRTAKPAGTTPVPGTLEGQAAPASPGTAAPAPGMTPPQAASPTAPPPAAAPPMPAPTAAAPAAPSMPPPPSAAPRGPVAATPPATAIPAPMFGEGQRVTVVLDPAAAGDTITLSQDPAGSKPGSTVRPGTPLTILDGDFQPTGWVYSVRSDDGAKGWVSEKRLRLKP